MLKTSVEELDKNKIAMTVEVEKQKVDSTYSSFFSRAAKYVNIPGFRRGKVPKSVLVNFIGVDEVTAQVEEELVNEVYPLAIKYAGVHPIGPFTIEESELSEGKAFKFKVVFEVAPKIGEFKYTGHEFTVPRTIVADPDVDKVLEKLQKQFTTTKPLNAEDNPVVMKGDFIHGESKAVCEDQTVERFNRKSLYVKVDDSDPVWLNAEGMKIGETKSWAYRTTNGADKEQPWYDKDIQITVTIDGVFRVEVPVVDDEFAKKLGDIESLDALKSRIREDLEAQSEHDALDRGYDQIIKEILSHVEIEVPEVMVETALDSYVKQLDARYRQVGLPLSDYLKRTGTSLQEFRNGFREKATFEAKVSLIIDKVGGREGIEVSDAEYHEEIETRAAQHGMSVDKLLSELEKNDGEDNIRYSLKNRKIHDFLLKNNAIHYDMVNEADINKGESQGDSGTDSN